MLLFVKSVQEGLGLWEFKTSELYSLVSVISMNQLESNILFFKTRSNKLLINRATANAVKNNFIAE